MGHQIGRRHRPRRASLQFWPRKRAQRSYPRIKSWPASKDVSALGFAGYKVGMTHVMIVDNIKNSPTKGMEVSYPVTVFEVPNLKVMAVRYYKKTTDGLQPMTQKFSASLSKDLERKISLPSAKKEEKPVDVSQVSDVRILVHTQPRLTGMVKKKPEIFEIALGGTSVNDKMKYAESILGNEIKITDVFKPGDQIDTIAVTKGKGFAGAMKRFHIRRMLHKDKKGSRTQGSHGVWKLGITFQVPMPGQLGYQVRTEFNKWLIKIGEKPEEINLKGGFLNYGLVKGNYVLLKGSVGGSRKRLVRFRKAIRPSRRIPPQPPEISYVSRESKQGV